MSLQCDNLSGELQDQWSSSLNIARKLTKMGIKIAFYVDVNVFLLSNLTVLKADISKTSSERYRFLLIFVCRTSKYTHMQKIKNFYREVNYVHLALIGRKTKLITVLGWE